MVRVPEKYAIFNIYIGAPLALVPLNITVEIVMEVGRRISYGAEPWGMDTVSLQYWIL